MYMIRKLAFAALVVVPGPSLASAPVLKVSKSVTIHATPAADATDATAIKTISSVYQSGLDNLNKLIEAK